MATGKTHSIGVVKLVYEIQTIKRHTFENPTYKDRGPTAKQSKEAMKLLHKYVR